MTLIKKYTPLWRGVGECGKTDCINIPIDREFWFWMPPVINMGQTTYQLVTDLGSGVFAHINFQDSINLGAEGFIGMIRVPSNGIAQFTKSDGTGFIGIDVAGTCKTLQLATWTILGFDTFVSLINEFFVFNFVPERACEDNLVQVKYKLDCDQTFHYTLYLSGAFVRIPLTLEDEVNAIRPDGRSKRVYSRFQTAKELRVRPVTLATHELLEHVLNMNSYEVDGFEVSPIAGAVYTPAFDTGIGRYSGRIALVVGAEVKRECCAPECCTYRVEGIELSGFATMCVTFNWDLYTNPNLASNQFAFTIYDGVNIDSFNLSNLSVASRTRDEVLSLIEDYFATSDINIVVNETGFCVSAVGDIEQLSISFNISSLLSVANTCENFTFSVNSSVIESECSETTGQSNFVANPIIENVSFQILINGSWTTIDPEEIVDGVWTLETCDQITNARIIDDEGNVIQTLEVQCL